MADRPIDVLADEIRDLVRRGEPAAAAQRLAEARADELPALFAQLQDQDLGHLLEQAPPEVSADVVEHLDADHVADLLEGVTPASASEILDQLATDEAVPVLEEMPPSVAAALGEDMDSADPRSLLAAYPEGTAGRLMTPHPFRVRDNMTVTQALVALRRVGREGEEAITYLYVVDAAGHLVGVASLRDVVIALPDVPIREVMSPFPVSVHVSTPEEECVRLFRHYRFLGLPVLDEDAQLVGVVRADRLLRQADEEAEDDLLGVFGVSAASDIDSVAATVRRRLPWLTANVLTAFLAAAVVGLFQGTIQSIVALAVFMPVIAGQGGNAGVQALSVGVRALATGGFDRRSVLRALRRELAAGLANGAAIGLVVGIVAGAMQRSLLFGAVVGGSMLGVMVAAAGAGALVPIALRLLRQDPAVGSGVIVTTVTDVIGFSLLLGVATLLLTYLT